MRRITSHAKSGLFLIEMIMCLLFLGLSCSICLRFFSAAYLLREEARTNNHIQELVITTSEILEAWEGEEGTYLELLSGAGLSLDPSRTVEPPVLPSSEAGSSPQESFSCFFSRAWEPSSPEEAYYRMQAVLTRSDLEKNLDLSFYRVKEEEEPAFYQNSVSFPAF